MQGVTRGAWRCVWEEAVLEVWKLVTAVTEAGQTSTSTESPKCGPSSAHTVFSFHSHVYTKKRCSGVQDTTQS